jgi:nucleoside-diphosphate-sugar epimerase
VRPRSTARPPRVEPAWARHLDRLRKAANDGFETVSALNAHSNTVEPRYGGITLVTGAAGFIGGHLIERLVGLGVRVRATSRSLTDTSFFTRLGVEFVPSDLNESQTLPPLFEGPVDRVFHLGAICNFSTPYRRLYPVNVRGVEHMTRLALEAKVGCYIHVGSTAVYGPSLGRPFTEDHPRRPNTDYGRSKRDGEDVVWARIGEGLPAIIARPCTVYGPRCTDGAGKAFSRRTSVFAVPGSGRQRLSNVRAEDVAAAAEHLSRRPDALGQAYNIADSSHPALEDALRLACEVFGAAPPSIHLPIPVVKLAALAQGLAGRMRGIVPEMEYDSLRFLKDDYIVDNGKLLRAGFTLRYPDFMASLRQLGDRKE